MISNLVNPSAAFKGNELHNARSTYSAKMEQNSQIAQNQNNAITNPALKPASVNSPISMQGSTQGQKLDVIA